MTNEKLILLDKTRHDRRRIECVQTTTITAESHWNGDAFRRKTVILFPKSSVERAVRSARAVS